MRVTTFYSYKGGVGRTLACANFGLYLAKTGQKVVLVDMDFEAPGLDSKFFPEATTTISSGVLDQILAFQGNHPLPNLSPIPIALPEEVSRSGGRLQLIPAGDYASPEKYHKNLSSLDWDFLLKTEVGLGFWFDLLSRIESQLQPDVLVIDSRTGITEVGGLCTQVLPHTVLLLSSTSPESMAGTRRIYERIKSSRIVKETRGPGANIDLRVVLTRVPRQENHEAFDRSMRIRMNLEIPRLYYLFADNDLATDEYLAMDSSATRGRSILSDYVELFATLNPEDTANYVKSRLASFREGLTLRKEAESRRVIQELLTLFPRSAVYLEAARYYRLVKEPEDSIVNYLRYLRTAPSHKEIILELAEVSVGVPRAALTPYSQALIDHLFSLGPEQMEAEILALFVSLTKSDAHLHAAVASIESDAAKLSMPEFRRTLFRALDELQQWDRLVGSAADLDASDVSMQRLIAKAHAKLHEPDKALQIIHRLPLRDSSDVLPILEILFDIQQDTSKDEIRKAIEGNRYLRPHLGRHAVSLLSHPTLAQRSKEFRVWLQDLLIERKPT